MLESKLTDAASKESGTLSGVNNPPAAGTLSDVNGMDTGDLTEVVVGPPGPPGPPGEGIKTITFPFAYDTPGLDAGIPIYTPVVGETLYDAWVHILTPWSGGAAYPVVDIGQEINPGTTGLFGGYAYLDLNFITSESGPPRPPNNQYLSLSAQFAFLNQQRSQLRFTDTAPLKLWVSQNGRAGGAATGAIAGSAVFKMMVIS